MNIENYRFLTFRMGLIILELSIFMLLFLFRVPKKKLCILKVISTIVITLGISFLIYIPLTQYYSNIQFDRNPISIITIFLILGYFGLLCLGFAFAFDVKLYELFSNVFLGFAARQIIFCIYSLILNNINPELLLIRINQQNIINILIYLAIYGSFITISTIMIYRKNNSFNRLTLELPIFVIMTIVIALSTLISSFAEVISDEHMVSYSFVLLSQILIFALLIIINFYTQKHIELKIHNELASTMLKKQEEQYKFAKANAEQMYVKAHDLKHQVAILRKGGEEAEKILSSLESVVTKHESVVLTDNSVVNIILSEKWQYCLKHNIKLTYTVDPDAFRSMENIHLYSLLGNILDNAIEAVMKIKNKDKRLITLTITHNKGLSMIQSNNYFIGGLKMDGEIPLTDKKDKGLHGFGIKSIRHISNIYNGNVIISSKGDIFTLQLAIPEEK